MHDVDLQLRLPCSNYGTPRPSLLRFTLTVVINRSNDTHDEYEEMHVSDLIDFNDKRPEVVIAKVIDKNPHLPSSSSLPPGETVGSFDGRC